MKIRIYKATLMHDNGKTHLNVISLSGKKEAKKQVIASEGCPETAIISIKKIIQKSV